MSGDCLICSSFICGDWYVRLPQGLVCDGCVTEIFEQKFEWELTDYLDGILPLKERIEAAIKDTYFLDKYEVAR